MARKRDRKFLRKLPLRHRLESLLRAQMQQPQLAALKPSLIGGFLHIDVREVYAAKARISK